MYNYWPRIFPQQCKYKTKLSNWNCDTQ